MVCGSTKSNSSIADINKKSKKMKDISIKQELHNRIQNAIISKNSRGKTYLGSVEEKTANIIKKLTGVDVKEKRHILADNDIRHMIKQHGNESIERTKGQIAININDIAKKSLLELREVSSKLTMLELDGKVVKLPGNMYIRGDLD